MLPKLIAELESAGLGDVVVVCGGVIPPDDYQFLQDAGVALIFGPGTKIPDAALSVLDEIERRADIKR